MLFDRPQVVEGSVIVNATVPAGTSDPSTPNVGELFFRTDIGALRTYNGSGWAEAGAIALASHQADATLHLTPFQNTLLDGLASTLTSTELNYVDGVTSPIQTQLDTIVLNFNTHTADDTRHLTAFQNTLLDGLASTLTSTELNYVDGVTSPIQTQFSTQTSNLANHMADDTRHLTANQNTFLDALDFGAETANAKATSVNALSAHLVDDTRHLTSAQNTLLDGLAATLSAAELNFVDGVTSNIQTQLNTLAGASFTQKLSTNGAIPMGADLSMGGFKITNLATPTVATDAATKDYVDSFVQGLHWVGSVKAATTGNIALSGLQTIDTVPLSINDRVLVKDQSTPSQNGIYLVASGAWTRASDYNSTTEINNSAVFVLEYAGASQSKSTWIQTATVGVLGTDPLSFSAFSGPVVNTAGNGISLGVNGLVSVREGAGIAFDGNGAVVVDVHSSGGLMLTTNNTSAAALTTTTAQLALTNSGVTAGTYNSSATAHTPFTVDAKGRITGTGANVTITPDWTSITSKPTTLTGYGITDAVPRSGNVTITGPLAYSGTATSGQFTLGGAIRAVQGVPNNADNSTTGYAFGGDGDSGMFALQSGVDSGALLFYLNNVERMRISASTVTIGGNTVWHSANDGAGSGLDADYLRGIGLSASGNRWNVIPNVAGDGVTEIGRYLDFHTSAGSVVDYAARIDSLPATYGTIALRGSNDAYQGVQFADTANVVTLMSRTSDNLTGMYQVTGGTWQWYYDPAQSNLRIGPSSYLAWHQGNLTNLNQLANGPGYITSAALAPYLPLAGGVMTGLIDEPYGIHGGYGTSSGSGGAWGSNIWGLGAAYSGSGVGTGYSAGSYGLSWLRSSHGSASSRIGEGLHVFAGASLQGGIGTNGMYTVGSVYANGALTAGNGNFSVGSNGVINTIQGNSPPNGAIRLTPNLHLNPNAGYAVITTWDNGNGGNANNQAFRVGNGAGGDVFYVTYAGATVVGSTLQVNSTLNCSANIYGSGHYTPTGTGYASMVGGNGSRTGYYEMYAATGARQGYIGYATTGGAINYVSETAGVHAFTGSITSSGSITASGDVVAYSDRRLKTDIEPIHDPLKKVEGLNGVTFKRVDTGEYGTGLIAQDVQAVMPNAVHEQEDGTLAVAYGNLAGLFAEAIKALNKEVAELRAELNALKGQQ